MPRPRALPLLLAALAALAVATAPLHAQSVADHPRVREALAAYEKWLDGERAFKKIPGVATAIVVDQDVIYQGATGYADLGRKVPASPDALYSICSISKLFTSIATLQLRDRGALRLDDPVTRHLPWAAPAAPPGDDTPVTVEGLLTHAAGLQRELADTLWLEPLMVFPSQAELEAGTRGRDLAYAPGRYFQYSNLGFTLLGNVVAAASGTAYHDYVAANVLRPLGLRNTFSEMPAEEQGKRLALGYSGVDRDGTRHPMPFFRTKAMAPAAGFASTARDLAAFAAWQFRLLRAGGTDVLAARTLREMQRVHFLDPGWETTWGLGFEVWRDEGQTFVGHGGSCPGYRTQLSLKPDQQLAIVVMTNAGDANAFALAQRGMDFLAPALKEARADSARTSTAAPASIDRYLGTYWGFGGEMEVIRWQGGLATLDIPSDRPLKAITRYRQLGDNLFREVRADGELGERLTFDLGPDGRPLRARTNYIMRRLR